MSASAIVPEYPFWNADRPEQVFGAPADRYLDISKDDARSLLSCLPEEQAMADMLFRQGHLGKEQFGMAGREWGLPEGVTAEDVRGTIAALLTSFGPSHEIKIATVAVAINRWFPRLGGAA